MKRTVFVVAGTLLAGLGGADPAQGQRVERGALAAGDEQLPSGEFFDAYDFSGQPGQHVVLTLTSDAFDTFLLLLSPSGKDTQNDDHEGSQNRSQIELDLDEAGQWRVVVTSYQKGETGAYELTMNLGGGGVAAGPLGGQRPGPLAGALGAGAAAGSRMERGELAAGDRELQSGEYFDEYTFDGRPGQAVTLTLTSDAFDTFLILVSPSGKDTQNDDDEGSQNRSRIETTLDEPGQWRVVVTSYQKGETGAYELAMNLGAGDGPAAGAPEGQRAGPLGGAMGRQDGARTERGELAAGDQQLRSGEYVDSYTFQGIPGQRARIDLRSGNFDTYLIVRDPSGEHTENDDAAEGATDHSAVELTMVAGQYEVMVTSYQKGETGSYELIIDLSGGGGGGKSPSGGIRNEHGRLEEGDRTLGDGEYLDLYTFDGRQGQRVVLDLRSTDFDPYLIFRGPGDQSIDNDDHEGDASRSLITAVVEDDGTQRVGVTSYRPGESGGYVLRMDLGGGGGVSAPIAERGTLQAGDDTLQSGEFVDSYAFQGTPGQNVTVDLHSNDFDTYLILIDPRDEQTENDDEGGTNRSLIQQTLTEPGRYRVLVTSYQPGERGDYDLTVSFGDDGTPAPDQTRQRDVSAIAMGETLSGRLETGDGQLDGGEYRDIYVFDGQAGQPVAIDMTSSEFDTYLGLIAPGGEDIQNDDYEGDQQRSRIELTLRESGRYRVVATSYAANTQGTYRLSLATLREQPPRVAAQPQPAPGAEAGGGRIYGVFAGISDYRGRASNLPYTADDAVRVRNAMIQGAGMNPSDGILLTDAQASSAGIQGAIQQLSSRMGPEDMFVFFYSGHGGRRPRPGGDFQITDPDGMDETLEFVDASVTDDQFNAWMDGVRAGRVLLLLDACFSGGFSKDVISRPGRMGMFSSEEDVTSSVAAKFRAGGYLAVFLADAIADKLADADGDGQINAIELSQYVHERYRADLKSADPGEFVRTGGPQLGFQHLVVDRGSIGPYDVLFR